ncbi:hypothetical protein OHB00_00770 [Streptomyces sp. NBC_00631]|uniref:hypothetical protein n=1 Tax=Streptomyces sp. NBC_00631 TaxID=2975793 RepID=UPI0030E0A525
MEVTESGRKVGQSVSQFAYLMREAAVPGQVRADNRPDEHHQTADFEQLDPAGFLVHPCGRGRSCHQISE